MCNTLHFQHRTRSYFDNVDTIHSGATYMVVSDVAGNICHGKCREQNDLTTQLEQPMT